MRGLIDHKVEGPEIGATSLPEKKRKVGKDAMMRSGCLITIPKAYRLVRIKEECAARPSGRRAFFE